MPTETQQVLLDLVSKTLPARVGQLDADRIVIGGQDHARVTPRKFAKPEYIGFSKDRHVQPEFCYIMDGKMGVQCQKRAYHLTPGDYCFIPGGMQHFETCVEPGEPYEVFWTRVPNPGTKQVWLVHCRYAGGHYQFTNTIHFPLTTAIFKSVSQLIKGTVIGLEDIKHDLTGFYQLVAEKIRTGDYIVHQKHVQEKKWKQKSLSRILEYIDNHLTEKLTVNTLAEQMSITPRYLSQLFKAEYGNSVMKFINSRKLTRSLVLLEKPDLNISEIAQQLNYTDVYYFSKAFKKHYGISPTRYREKYL